MAHAGGAGGLRVLRVVRTANTRRGMAGQRGVRELCKIAFSHYPQKINHVFPVQPPQDIDGAGSAGSETVFSTYALRDSKKGMSHDVRVWAVNVGLLFSVAVREEPGTASQYPHHPHGQCPTPPDLRVRAVNLAGGCETHYPQGQNGHPRHHPPRSSRAGLDRASERTPNP